MREVLTVRDWLKALGMLCAGNGSVKEAQARLSAYATLLAREFKPAAFTTDSLTAVARDCTFFPSFGELSKALSAWWEDNGPYEPTVPLLTGPKLDIPKPREPVTEAEAAAVDVIMTNWRMEIGYGKSRPLPDEPTATPKPLPSQALLATYEKLAAAGDRAAAIRIAMLRRTLAATEETSP